MKKNIKKKELIIADEEKQKKMLAEKEVNELVESIDDSFFQFEVEDIAFTATEHRQKI